MVNKKERGKFLTIMIVLGVIGIIQLPFSLWNTEAIQKAYGSVPSWYTPYLLFGFVIGIANTLGLWLWKKWSFYTLTASIIIGILINVFFFTPIDPTVKAVTPIMIIISAGLWFWAIYRKRQFFE